jgi:LDH2 family malate/lactate/ureidoglycolate dehydrogenase
MDRYRIDDLLALADALFRTAGMEADKAATVARALVEADLLGHQTHGLALLPDYVEELESGLMRGAGTPEIVADRTAAALWDGGRLPGPWLVEQALDAAIAKAREAGSATIVVRRSHHIACLAAFLERPARAGFLVTIASSDPSAISVTPFGGTSPIMTPDPIAIGFPTTGDPVMIDISASITTNAMCARAGREGGRLPGRWLVTAEGEATDEVAALKADPPGALLPTGGLDHGQKGYGMALFVEALTQGLAGHGRADDVRDWGADFTVQAFDPALLAGTEAFRRQTGWLADACRAARPADPGKPVRLPGEAGLARKRKALAEGVSLRADATGPLAATAARLGVAMPAPL